jgi:hypothetical protein
MGNNKITGLANGTANTDAAAYGQVIHAAGQCRLEKVGSNIVLMASNGNQITIGGLLYVIPSSGVSLPPTGLTVGTNYYIYAFMTGINITLEASTTLPVGDTATGVTIKTGDSSRTLVGFVRPITGPAFQDTNNQRFVISWFNRRKVNVRASPGVATATSSSTPVEFSTAFRAEFLSWNFDAIQAGFTGFAGNSVASGSINAFIYLNNTVKYSNNASCVALANSPINLSHTAMPPTPNGEGYNYINLVGSTSSGTATFDAESYTWVQILG